jgi:hypothetical protein
MSYVAVPWEMYHTPIPYPPEGDWGQPVPGWGQIPTCSGPPGPPMLSVGSYSASLPRPRSASSPLPYYYSPPRAVGADYGIYTGPKGGGPVFTARPTLSPTESTSPPGESGGGLPWWGWVAGAAVVGVGIAVAQNKHWI